MRTLALAFALMLLAPRVALARNVDAEVKKLANQSHQQYENGDYQGAAATLLKAYELKPVPTLLFNIARAYEKAGDDDKALDYYRRFRDSQPDDAQLVAQASRAIDRLEQEKRDKEKAAEAAREKQLAQEQAEQQKLADQNAQLEQQQKQQQQQQAASQQVPPAPPPRSRVLPYTLIGVGSAAVVGGAVLGLTAKSLANDEKASTDPVKKPDLRSQAHTRALIADVAYGVGAAALVTGIVLIATEPKSEPVESTNVGSGSASSRVVPGVFVFDRGAGISLGGTL